MAAELYKDGTKRICLSKKQFDEMAQLLRGLYQKTKCGAAIVADGSGMLVAQSGTLSDDTKILLASLAAGNYAATNEMAKLLNEGSGFKVSFLEGSVNSLYVTAIDESFFFVLVFGTNTTFGMVRVLVAKLLEQLKEILSRPVEGEMVEIVKKEMESAGFQEELSSRLEAVLFGKA